MPSKRRLVRELEKLSNKFLKVDKRKELLVSLSGDKTVWFLWVSQMKGVFKNIDKAESIKFAGLILLLEQKPKSNFYRDNLKKFLINKIEFYKHYDFSAESKLTKEGKNTKKLWTNKIFRLFISRSFLGMLILILILGFILWFYIDRESCLEFVDRIIQPFLRAIR